MLTNSLFNFVEIKEVTKANANFLLRKAHFKPVVQCAISFS